MVFNATFNNISVISWRSVLSDYTEKTTDLSHVTDKLYHIMVYTVFLIISESRCLVCRKPFVVEQNGMCQKCLTKSKQVYTFITRGYVQLWLSTALLTFVYIMLLVNHSAMYSCIIYLQLWLSTALLNFVYIMFLVSHSAMS